MNKNCIVLLFKFSCFSNCIVESISCENDFEPLSSKSLDTLNLEFWCSCRHDYCSFNFESLTAVSYTLSMVAGTCCYDSSLLFLFCQGSESITSSSDFETSYILKIFSFEINFSIIFFGEILRFCQRSVFDNSFTFSIGLIDFVSWDEFRMMISI